MTTCTETIHPPLAKRGDAPVACMREVDDTGRHKGQHQGIDHFLGLPARPENWWNKDPIPAYDRLVTWSEGGSTSCKYDPDVPNANCMCKHRDNHTGHQPEDHRWDTCAGCGIIFDTTGATRCHSCRYWQNRVDNYGKVMPKGERFVRPHDDSLARFDGAWLYAWSPGHGGGFGGRKFTVTFDDGTVVGPADFLWSNGRIPWWLVDEFPPNARISDSREHELRPGYTDRFGKTLPYTAHPSL
jgi:hypothetical protein